MSEGKKLLYIFDAADWNSRIPVARAARARGMDVTIGLIAHPSFAPKNTEDFSIITFEKPLRMSLMPRLMLQIRRSIKINQPNILHCVTLKYAILCGLAALQYQAMQKVYTFAGLGYLYHGHSKPSAMLRVALKPVLKFLLRQKNTIVIFQNPDDLNCMTGENYLQAQQCRLIRGSGVDLETFKTTMTSEQSPPLVLMPTRLVREKGIHIFIEAARILKNRGINAQFQIAGGETTHNPKALSSQDMQELTKDGSSQWIGRVDDMPALLARAALIVYPSYYGEGIPRVLLEACAAGKAIVTTDHTGCREVLSHGVNGLLVPIKDAAATANAIEAILGDSAMRKDMGSQSRLKAEREFDIHLIAQKTVDVYEI